MAHGYGWSLTDIYRLYFNEVVQYYKILELFKREEAQRMIDFISFPHTKKEYRQHVINAYVMNRRVNVQGDAKALSARFSSHVKKKDQPWPKGR